MICDGTKLASTSRSQGPEQALINGENCGMGFGRGMHGPAPEPLDCIELRTPHRRARAS